MNHSLTQAGVSSNKAFRFAQYSLTQAATSPLKATSSILKVICFCFQVSEAGQQVGEWLVMRIPIFKPYLDLTGILRLLFSPFLN
jgi:hypothetical protein